MKYYVVKSREDICLYILFLLFKFIGMEINGFFVLVVSRFFVDVFVIVMYCSI